MRGVQFLEPLFEFSGACAGCGETPYLKLLSQLFGDRAQIANATGCSSIYGANLPVTPWTKDREGRGPAWSNSLFEDNAEFGLGFRLAADKHLELARTLLRELAPRRRRRSSSRGILEAPQIQRIRDPRPAHPRRRAEDPAAQAWTARPRAISCRWSIIWSGAASGSSAATAGPTTSATAVSTTSWRAERDVNVLVLDTEVYSNTGGQASKATPLGAVAKFATAGKRVARKDLALQAIAYGNVYVAQVAMGANPQQTLDAFREAEAYAGTSLILAYSQCIAHGIDMRFGMKQQDLAVASGYWPLLRFNPAMRTIGENPFRLDSPRPTIPFKDYAYNEIRYSSLAGARPEEAAALLGAAQAAVDGEIPAVRGPRGAAMAAGSSRGVRARLGHDPGLDRR